LSDGGALSGKVRLAIEFDCGEELPAEPLSLGYGGGGSSGGGATTAEIAALMTSGITSLSSTSIAAITTSNYAALRADHTVVGSMGEALTQIRDNTYTTVADGQFITNSVAATANVLTGSELRGDLANNATADRVFTGYVRLEVVAMKPGKTSLILGTLDGPTGVWTQHVGWTGTTDDTCFFYARYSGIDANTVITFTCKKSLGEEDIVYVLPIPVGDGYTTFGVDGVRRGDGATEILVSGGVAPTVDDIADEVENRLGEILDYIKYRVRFPNKKGIHG
jgi:hypothetical protein